MIRNLDYSYTRITGGFWKKKQDMVRKTTIKAVYDRFDETGRMKAFKFKWKPGDPDQPHIYWDSDVAKWIEGAAYIVKLYGDRKLERIIDGLVDDIVANQADDGYFNIYHQIVSGRRFYNRGNHELYCAGHLFEAAVAYYDATGKRKFLDAMCRYADYIELRFMKNRDTDFTTPGHEEIELALVRLYSVTGEKRYLDLAKFFIDERGTDRPGMDQAYTQSHLPVREQTEAFGHAVRAVYLYCGMADIARETGDRELLSACKKLFDNIVTKKMYITGGIGSSSYGEKFTVAYDLPNIISYTETCASLGLALFAARMQAVDLNSKYADVIERVIYNGFMSSTSLDGTSFYYENPMEIIPYLSKRNSDLCEVSEHFPNPLRSRVFECSCCPPNIVRFIPSIANMMYSDDGSVLYVHQFMQAKTELKRGDKIYTVYQETKYPENGKVKITVKGGDTTVAVRIPGWCKDYEIKGATHTNKGYAYFEAKDGESFDVSFKMNPVFIEARPELKFNCNRCAVMRGPIVYCMEGVDNGENLRDITLDTRARFRMGKIRELDIPTLTVKAYRRTFNEDAPLYRERTGEREKIDAVLIPYYAFANRGESEMLVWCNVR